MISRFIIYYRTDNRKYNQLDTKYCHESQGQLTTRYPTSDISWYLHNNSFIYCNWHLKKQLSSLNNHTKQNPDQSSYHHIRSKKLSTGHRYSSVTFQVNTFTLVRL